MQRPQLLIRAKLFMLLGLVVKEYQLKEQVIQGTPPLLKLLVWLLKVLLLAQKVGLLIRVRLGDLILMHIMRVIYYG